VTRSPDLPEGAGIFVVGPTIGLLIWGMLGCAAVKVLSPCQVRAGDVQAVCRWQGTPCRVYCPGETIRASGHVR